MILNASLKMKTSHNIPLTLLKQPNNLKEVVQLLEDGPVRLENLQDCVYLRATTLTLNVHVALLPDPSVKVYVTWVVPTPKKDPGACVLDDNEAVPLLSVAVGSVHVTVVPPTPLLTALVTSLMQETVGGMVSTEKDDREREREDRLEER